SALCSALGLTPTNIMAASARSCASPAGSTASHHTSSSHHNSLVGTPVVSTPLGSASLNRPYKLRRLNHSDELINGFTRFLGSGSMTDVTLICKGGQTIRAHRVILSAFSPYFRSIFEEQPFAN